MATLDTQRKLLFYPTLVNRIFASLLACLHEDSTLDLCGLSSLEIEPSVVQDIVLLYKVRSFINN